MFDRGGADTLHQVAVHFGILACCWKVVGTGDTKGI